MNTSLSSPPKRSRRSNGGVVHRAPEFELPLHLALAYLLVRVHPINSEGAPINIYSAAFISSILQLVAREIYEVGYIARTYDNLKAEVDSLVESECASIARLNEKVRSRGQLIAHDRADAENFESWLETFATQFEDIAEGCAFLDNLEKDVRVRMNEDDEEDLTELPEPIERRSPFGLFLRGILLTLRKLSFDETSQLSVQVGAWCGVAPGPSRTSSHLWSLNRRAAMEETSDKRSNTMQEFQNATENGDYAKALTSLRRFYDYQFPAAGNKGQHQHALLNLATFHYSQGGISSAKAAIDEAIRVARAENDKPCLRQCMSLRYRLQAETNSAAFLPDESPRIYQQPLAEGKLQTPATPFVDLWSIKTALDMAEPVHVAMRRIHLTLARHEDLMAKSEGKREGKQGIKPYRPFPLAPWHATQAGLWSMIGCHDLAELHEDLAIKDAAGDADTRLTVLLSRAERAASSGRCIDALGILLDFDSLDHMSLAMYHRWARKVWSTLELWVSLSGDVEAMDLLVALKPPDELSVRLGPGANTRELGQSLELSGMSDPSLRGVPLAHEEVQASLLKARKLKNADFPPHVLLPHVLSAVHLSAELGLWPLYRKGIVQLAEVLLCIEGQGMAARAMEEVEAIWEQILNEGNQENTCRALLVLAKAKLDVNSEDSSAAEAHLRQALLIAGDISARDLRLQALTLLAIVAEMRGQPDEELLAAWERDDVQRPTDEIRKIGEIVKLVGVRVSGNWT
ncbi:anaphase-promoting complex subunit 5-domain-containing protein [Kockovaella imperatae]|uniref:Anaphase-promoting complex subunit 5 n=1 Tax=Kockovaella imperatae TaxID=4999 RepID=A0A1Y1UFM2_9TREE|nr:anaphase-promoting complex subunit 5-domain-containing protein [Kockovaella imperatae]ORX36306.1 anaphase-promoting complex subunit 5-domain-containing protein [Kockovaella imperatae]